MNRLQLFRLIRKNLRLGDRRSPAFEQNVIAKVMMAIGGLMFVGYLIFFGVMLGLIAKSEGAGFLIAVLPAILTIDFFMRFMVQQTPLMLIKPYILQPISKYVVIENFLLTSLTSIYNFLWLALFLPYAIIAWSGGCSLGSSLLVVVIGLVAIELETCERCCHACTRVAINTGFYNNRTPFLWCLFNHIFIRATTNYSCCCSNGCID